MQRGTTSTHGHTHTHLLTANDALVAKINLKQQHWALSTTTWARWQIRPEHDLSIEWPVKWSEVKCCCWILLCRGLIWQAIEWIRVHCPINHALPGITTTTTAEEPKRFGTKFGQGLRWWWWGRVCTELRCHCSLLMYTPHHAPHSLYSDSLMGVRALAFSDRY